MLPTPELIKTYISTNLDCSYIKIEGDGQHFIAVIVSNAFNKKNLIERHKLVYKILGDRMREEIHALSIKTFTPNEFQRIR